MARPALYEGDPHERYLKAQQVYNARKFFRNKASFLRCEESG